MTKKQINDLLKTHRAQRDYAKRMLDEHYYELEERDEETRWINDYLKHKQAVEWLEAQKPDD